MKKESIEIKGVKFKLSDRTIELTMEETKKLHALLCELFGKEIIRQEHHYHNQPWWYYPITYQTISADSGNNGNITYATNFSVSDNLLSVNLNEIL